MYICIHKYTGIYQVKETSLIYGKGKGYRINSGRMIYDLGKIIASYTELNSASMKDKFLEGEK